MPNKVPVKASTQEHLEVADVRDDLVLLKNGSVALILQTTAVNFGLLSETEQDATIFAYAGLLNSLSFSVQIVIRSKRSDVSAYIKLLNQQEARQTNPDLKTQIRKYREFVSATVQQNQVLDKSFYFVIPFSALQLGTAGAVSALTGKSKKLPYPKDYILDRAKTNLYPKRDHLTKQLNRIGLNARQLTTQELVELFYDIYNPTEVAAEKVSADVKDYIAPIVAPAVEVAQEIRPAVQTKEPLRPSQKTMTPEAGETLPKSTGAPISQTTTGQEALQQKLTAKPAEQPTTPVGEPAATSTSLPMSQTSKSSQSQQEALKALQEAMTKAQETLKNRQTITQSQPGNQSLPEQEIQKQ